MGYYAEYKTLSLPSPRAFLASLVTERLHYRLGAWNRLKSMKSMGMKLFRRDLLSKVIIATHFDMTQT